MRRFVLAAFTLILLGGCQPQAGTLTDEDVSAIRDLAMSYAQGVITGNADVVAAVYAEDATEMPPQHPANQGREAIRAAYGAATESFTITPVVIDGLGGLAYDRGVWSYSPTVADTTAEVTGGYLCIARKQKHGSWLWTDVIWNTDAPAP